jgi:hypothetical protein
MFELWSNFYVNYSHGIIFNPIFYKQFVGQSYVHLWLDLSLDLCLDFEVNCQCYVVGIMGGFIP